MCEYGRPNNFFGFVFAHLGTNKHFSKKIEIGASHKFSTLAPWLGARSTPFDPPRRAVPPRPLVSILIHDLNRKIEFIWQ